jgi:hypothetical protein
MFGVSVVAVAVFTVGGRGEAHSMLPVRGHVNTDENPLEGHAEGVGGLESPLLFGSLSNIGQTHALPRGAFLVQFFAHFSPDEGTNVVRKGALFGASKGERLKPSGLDSPGTFLKVTVKTSKILL